MRENLGEFGSLLQIRQIFTRQLLVASEIAIEAAVKFAKVYLATYYFPCTSPKFPFIWYGPSNTAPPPCMTSVLIGISSVS